MAYALILTFPCFCFQQRVSIARAAYNTHAQVVLLDDPLSAVDMVST